MWFAQIAWNQNVSMPTVRQPTSEFQRKNPGAKASPSISVQPAGSMRKQNMSCSPPYRPVAPLKPFGRRLEVGGELLDHVQQVGVVQPRVAGGVDRAELAAQGEQAAGASGPAAAFRANTRAAVSGVSRLTVSLATPESRQSWPKLQSFIWNASSSPASSISRSVLTGLVQSVRGGCQISSGLLLLPLEVLRETSSDGKVSSGVRRNSSCEARVRFIGLAPFGVVKLVKGNVQP